jgi:hypothetical protein
MCWSEAGTTVSRATTDLSLRLPRDLDKMLSHSAHSG